MRGRCQSCHRAPQDEPHRGTNLPCGQCHQPAGWKPATFDHNRYFVLDRNHRLACVTCHTGQNYGRYTCYGCHKHTPARTRAAHEEEGMTIAFAAIAAPMANLANAEATAETMMIDRAQRASTRSPSLRSLAGLTITLSPLARPSCTSAKSSLM